MIQDGADRFGRRGAQILEAHNLRGGPNLRVGVEQAGDVAVDHVPVVRPAADFLARRPRALDRPHPFAVPQVHRPAVAAELEMARPLHPRQRPRMLPLAPAEPPVLTDQGGDVAGRRAHRADDLGIREEPNEIGEAGDVVVRLGDVARRPLGEQQLSQVRAVKGLERRVADPRRQPVVDRRVVAAGEKSHPEHFLEGVGAFRRDQHPVPVGPFARGRRPAPGRRLAPPVGGVHHRVILDPVGGDARSGGHDLVQERAARTGQAANVNRHPYGDRVQLLLQKARFQPPQSEPELPEAVNRPAEKIEKGRDVKRRVLARAGRSRRRLLGRWKRVGATSRRG